MRPDSSVKKILSNSIYLFIATACATGARFVVDFKFINYLGKKNYGDLSIAFSIALIAAFTIDLGTRYGLVKYASQNQGALPWYFANSVILRLFFLVPYLFLGGGICFFGGYDPVIFYYLLLVLPLILFESTLLLCSSVFQVKETMGVSAVITVGINVAKILGVIFIVGLGLSVMAFLSVNTALVFLMLVISLGATVKIGGWDLNLSRFKTVLKDSLPFGWVNVLFLAYFYGPILLLGLFQSSEEVSLFTAAQRFIIAAMLIPALNTTVLMPVSYRKGATDRGQLAQIYRIRSKILFAIGLLMTILFIILADPIVRGFYRIEFYGSTLALMILAPIAVIKFIGVCMEDMICSIDRQMENLKIALSILILSLILNLVFIPAYGYIGAAIALVLSELALLIRDRLKMFGLGLRFELLRGLWKAVVAGMACVLALWLLSRWLNIWLASGLASGLYLLVYLYLFKKYADPDEKMILNRFGINP